MLRSPSAVHHYQYQKFQLNGFWCRKNNAFGNIHPLWVHEFMGLMDSWPDGFAEASGDLLSLGVTYQCWGWFSRCMQKEGNGQDTPCRSYNPIGISVYRFGPFHVVLGLRGFKQMHFSNPAPTPWTPTTPSGGTNRWSDILGHFDGILLHILNSHLLYVIFSTGNFFVMTVQL